MVRWPRDFGGMFRLKTLSALHRKARSLPIRFYEEYLVAKVLVVRQIYRGYGFIILITVGLSA
jgi:hypothetical protein